MGVVKSFNLAQLLLTLTCLFCCYSMISFSFQASPDDFFGCVSEANIPVSKQGEDSFNTTLDKYIRNPKFLGNITGRPLYIMTPTSAIQVQAAVLCGSQNKMPIRVRSGGHDYEGLSYRSVDGKDFAILDMLELRTVHVDNLTSTAWVESGATLGELYYKIGNVSNVLGFPAGLCPTVGVGGHFSGGGFGMLLRKYGLAIDNVIDAVLVDAKGRLLNKTSMGSDVFWAIRGGGGESFGVVLKWQVKLVNVTPTVTVFNVSVSTSQGAVDNVTKWQQVAPALPDHLFIRVVLQNRRADFQSLFLGTCKDLLPVMNSHFPELRFSSSDCKEMSWIKSVPYVYLGNNSTVDDLLTRTSSASALSHGFKMTSDFARQAIPRDVWASIFIKLAQPEAREGLIILDPYGGQISRVPESATPFPHRAGVLYNIQYINYWEVASENGTVQTKWINDLYAFMAPHVSSNPREAYFNYRDLNLGDSYQVWGPKYFKGNYRRLAMVKAEIDPDDYFSNEQSIPPQLISSKIWLRESPSSWFCLLITLLITFLFSKYFAAIGFVPRFQGRAGEKQTQGLLLQNKK